MIPVYQINILKKEASKSLENNDVVLFNALSNAIRVLETHICPTQSSSQKYPNKQKDNSLDAFRDNRGESQSEKFGY